MAKFNDISGRRFGRLTAVKPIRGNGRIRWECVCDCGRVVQIVICNLNRPNTRSCGCLRKETTSKTKRTHGMTESATYRIWTHMWQRCTNPKNKRWMQYGGRGVSVCARWESFENFLQDMGEKPVGHSIDRINNDGNYEPANCRWASIKTQQNNTSTNHLITAFGKTMTVTQWAELIGIRAHTIHARLTCYGWTPEEALSVEDHRYNGPVEVTRIITDSA